MPCITSIGAFRDSQLGRSRSAKPRVLLYSHDTYGLGHLRRNLAITAHILHRKKPYSAMLLTGSPVIGSWPMPEGLHVCPLPAVIKTAAEKYESRDPSQSFASVKARRETLILESIRQYRPDIFLVDHAPAGMKGELLNSLAFIHAHMPGTRVVLGLRDILDSPAEVRDLWRAQGIYHLLDTHYDHILVYGSQHLFDAVHEYHLPPWVAAKARYCGYIVRDAAHANASSATASSIGERHRRPTILVTAGGGGDGFPLMDGYLRAVRTLPEGALHSIVVAGPLMDIEQRRRLERGAAENRDVRIIAHTTELTDLIQRADLIVAMCGYNTTAEILAARKPSILVPRAGPRAEQRLRATLIGKLGLAWIVQPEEDRVARLTELVGAIVNGHRPALRAWSRVDLGGVHRVGKALDEILGYFNLPREASA